MPYISSNHQDAITVTQSLINLRESVTGLSSVENDTTENSDIFGIAQTIINLALMHVRSTSETSGARATDAVAGTGTTLAPTRVRSLFAFHTAI
jgi:hypothetical protein